MALSPGFQIGPHEITGLLGTGGMGEVYRATDTNLKRQVALKVLPAQVAGDAERLARFQREAEVLASLNHPHIAAIYGLERSGATTALVMELVEGEDLSERIARGAIPLDEALPIAMQIAEALEAAHGQGIIHRDLKPANIKVKDDGTVKVLDFGLAKALEPGAGNSEPGTGNALANSPTITSPAMTMHGMILGTAAYMSPEQARGAIVDKRADIWAFGVVLYEMITGTRLFDGGTVSDTLASVLKTEVDWSHLPSNTPAAVRRLLRHCLARDRKQRLQDIGDARVELSEIGEERDPVPATAVPPSRSTMLRLAATFVAGVAVTLAGAAAWSSRSTPVTRDADSRPFTFLITPADGVELEDPPNFSVSPDGRSILLKGFDGGVPYWYVKNLASGAVRRLNSTEGAASSSSAWSPDSLWILFTRQATLYKLAIDDTRLEAVTEKGVQGIGAAWAPSGEFLRISAGRLIAFRGPGVERALFETEDVLRGFAFPLPLPDGKRVLLNDFGDPTGRILVANLDGSALPSVVGKGFYAAFAAPDWLLALQGEQLLAWPFDTDRAVTVGAPGVVASGLRWRGGTAARLFSVSQTGVLAVRSDSNAGTNLTWFDRTGAAGAALKLSRHCRNPEFSRDYRRVAMECYEGINRDIWLYDLGRDAASRFTVDPADDGDPVWSPDDKTIAFSSDRLGAVDVFRKNSGGAANDDLMIETPGGTPVMAWSPDGKTIALMRAGPSDLVRFEVGTAEIHPIVTGPFLELELQFSPDGRFISYSSDESGRAEVYVQPWPQNGEKWQVSTDGATDARWRSDSKELFFLSPTRELMAAAIDTRNGFRAATPVRLFKTRVAGPLGSGHRFPYAVAADGQRFLMYVNGPNAPPPSITVIVNWPALLQK